MKPNLAERTCELLCVNSTITHHWSMSLACHNESCPETAKPININIQESAEASSSTQSALSAVCRRHTAVHGCLTQWWHDLAVTVTVCQPRRKQFSLEHLLSGRMSRCPTVSSIAVAGTVVPFHDTVKLLGVTLDSAVTLLKWSEWALWHIRQLLTINIVHLVRQTTHCCMAHLQPTSTICRLCRTHCTRVICQAPRSASATKLRQQLHWLPVHHRINYKLAVVTYKTITTSHLIHDYNPGYCLSLCW